MIVFESEFVFSFICDPFPYALMVGMWEVSSMSTCESVF